MKDDFAEYKTTIPVPPVSVTTKKRKRTISSDDGDDLLRQKARFYAKSPEA